MVATLSSGSLAERVRVTDVNLVYVSPEFTVTEPVGGVVSETSKLAVSVPGPFSVAVVDPEFALLNVIDGALLDQEENA